MSETLKYSNSLLLTKASLLSSCCCGSASGIYWEAVPCNMNMDLRGGACAEWDQCQFADRVFVPYDSRCHGTAISICEAQRLRIANTNLIGPPTNYNDVIYAQFTGIGGTVGQIVWGTETVRLITTGMDDIEVSLLGKTLAQLTSELMDQVNVSQIGRWVIFVAIPDFNSVSSYAIQPETIGFLPSDVDYFSSKTSGLYLDFNGTEMYVEPTSDLATFEINLQSALTAGVGAGISVVRNDYLGTYYGENNLVFDIIFGGALCGIDQPRITTLANIMQGVLDYWTYHDSNTTYSYLNPEADGKFYFVAGTGVPCGYEITAGVGPTYYQGVQCSPQKGTTIGPNQYVTSDTTGYCYDSCLGNGPFDNLENTFTVNSSCYSLTKAYFLFGMDGRLTRDYWHNRALHVTPECEYPTDCASSVPCNCTPELFIPMWHKNAPWGPFGSYYNDIELEPHPAWLSPYNTSANPYTNGFQSYLSSGYPDAPRSGWDYRPYGYVQTIGEWVETKEIGIYFTARRNVPFHVGDQDYDDLDQYIVLDTSTISPDLTVTYSNGVGCGPIQIGFFCSGKTVGEYLDAINAIKTSGNASVSGCFVFAFCAASQAARNMPASRIINTSAEIFESQTAGYFGDDLGTPLLDGDLRSGSHIVLAKAYDRYFANSPTTLEFDLGSVTQYNQPLTPGPNAVASTPPLCRALTYHLPKVNEDYGVAARGNSMWWTAMPLCNTTALNVGLATINPDIDPVFTEAWVKVATGIVTLFASGRHVATTGINTRPSGEYTVQDLVDTINGIEFTWASGTYIPFVATTDLVNECWLDDVTSITGSTYTYDATVPSVYNFSYREPLLDLAQTNISVSTHAALSSNIRRLCYWGPDADNDEVLPPCVPPDATTASGPTINCNGDDVVDGSWRIAYGCTSNVCLTQWFIPASRCSCDTVSRCDGIDTKLLPHPFNQEVDGMNSQYWSQNGYADTSVYQPLLYVCEYNFHPNCDIPCMVKVPFAVVQDDVVYFQNGTELTLPGSTEFCNDDAGAIYSNSQGWCQYFDPLAAKVQQIEIPRKQHPLAFIAGRTAGAFCSVNPWNFEPRTTRKNTVPMSLSLPSFSSPSYFNFPDGCVDVGDPGYASAEDCTAGACFSCDGWDRICNLGIVYETTIDYLADPTALCALFRPILKDITAADVCAGNTYGCNRIDIDCATACCECGFSCEADADCLDTINNGYYTQAITYSYTDSSQGYSPGMNGCTASIDTGNPNCLAYAPGFCISTVPGACNKPACINEGYLTSSFTVNLTFDNTPCGCTLPNTPVDRTYSYVSDCGYSLTCGDPACVTFSASPNPDPTTVVYDCGTPIGCPAYTNDVVVTSGRVSFDDGCIGGLGGWGIYYDYVFTTTTTFNSTGPDECDGEYTCDFSKTIAATYEVQNGDPECASPANVSLNSTENGSYSVGNREWGACGYTSMSVTPKALDYIWEWPKANSFACGYAGLFLSGSGSADNRVIGPICTGV